MNDIKTQVKFSFLVAIELIVCFTPLGSIPFGPIVATTSMIPVIITTLVLGLNAGMFLGFLFGLFSFIVWTFVPPNPAMAFIFTPFYSFGGYNGNFFSIIICFVPRILIAVTTYYSNIFIKKHLNEKISFAISSLIGSFTNTLLVMLFISLFFGKQYEELVQNSILAVIVATVTTNGLIEGMLSMIICPTVSFILNKRG